MKAPTFNNLKRFCATRSEHSQFDKASSRQHELSTTLFECSFVINDLNFYLFELIFCPQPPPAGTPAFQAL